MNTNTNTKNLDDQLRLLPALRNELLLAESRADAYAWALEVAGKDSAETWSQVVALARDAAYKSQAETTTAWRRYEILAAGST